MAVDMSPEAVTGRMQTLNQLWELAAALQSSDIENSKPVNSDKPSDEPCDESFPTEE